MRFNAVTASTPDLERVLRCARNPQERREIQQELNSRRTEVSDNGTPSLFAPRNNAILHPQSSILAAAAGRDQEQDHDQEQEGAA